jgi:hypothetical protein
MGMNMSENKGYRFKIEYVSYLDDETSGDDDSKMTFTAYGDTAKDTVAAIDEIKNEWDLFVEKWEKKNINNAANKDESE